MTDELKPVRCGCGGEARVDWTVINGAYMAGVVCQKCGTKTTSFYDRDDKDKVIAEAVTAWNKAMSGSAEEKLKAFWDGMSAEMKEERKAKVEKVDTNSPHSQVYKCCKCGQYTHRTAWSRDVHYCPSCGCRLEWNE